MSPANPSVIRRVWTKIRSFFSRVRAWCVARYESAVPGPRARRGAALAVVATVLLLTGFMGSQLRTSLGLAADIAIGVVVGLVTVYLGAWLLQLLARLIRALPRWLGFAGTGGLVALGIFLTMTFFVPQLALALLLGLVIVEGTLGGTLAFAFSPEMHTARWWKKLLVLSGLLLSVGANVALGWWLTARGSDSHLVKAAPAADPAPPLLAAPDPGARGPYAVKTLTYGSGTNRVRAMFAAPDLKTEPVDARPFVRGFSGWGKKLRRWFWGFGPEAFPLNGRVWYPDGPGPFPLVLIVHGNHHMAEFSDPGYEYLGEHLASRGFILVSVDENFLNGSPFGGVPKENDARGWLLLQHLKVWQQWNRSEGHAFYRRVDMDNLGLIGHSRGGEAVGHAGAFNRLTHYPDDARVTFDFHFAIKALIAIAPIDGQYKPADRLTPLADVNYLVIQGGHDADVSLFAGDRQYNRVRFTGGDGFKASIYSYRANHGQFNTVWGDNDWGSPTGWLLSRKPLLAGEDQRRIALVYFTAFLEATLRGDRRFRALFRDGRMARHWLPEDIYVTRYEDASFREVAGFEEDVDVTTATLPGITLRGEGLTRWREGDVGFRWSNFVRENNAVFLGWKVPLAAKDANAPKEDPATPIAPPSYEISFLAAPARDLRLDGSSLLVFQLAQADEDPEIKDDDEKDEKEKPEKKEEESKKEKPKDKEKREPVDLTVELVARDGTVARLPLSRFRALPPVLKVRLTKGGRFESSRGAKAAEPVLQTFELPLAAFAQAEPKFRVNELAAVRFVFDRSAEGVVILDRLGFARAPVR